MLEVWCTSVCSITAVCGAGLACLPAVPGNEALPICSMTEEKWKTAASDSTQNGLQGASGSAGKVHGREKFSNLRGKLLQGFSELPQALKCIKLRLTGYQRSLMLMSLEGSVTNCTAIEDEQVYQTTRSWRSCSVLKGWVGTAYKITRPGTGARGGRGSWNTLIPDSQPDGQILQSRLGPLISSPFS